MSDLLDRIASVLTPEEVASIAARKPVATPPSPPTTPPPTQNPRLLVKGYRHEYSTMYPGDVKHRGILLEHEGGANVLHYTDTGLVNQRLPAQISASSQPRWRRTAPDHLVFRYLNELRDWDAGSGAITTIRKFAEYTDINNGIGESDISEDDRHIALFGGLSCFVYDFVADKVEYRFNLTPGTFDNFYITSDNQVIVGYNQYHMLHRKDGSTLLLAYGLGHMDTSSDKNRNPVMVWCNSADDSGENRNAALPNCKNGVVLIDVTSGKQTCLVSLKDNWPAMHISTPDHADFALASTYTKDKNEVLRVGFDGKVTSLVTMPGNTDYDLQPHASISHDGTRFVYNSGGDTWMGTI